MANQYEDIPELIPTVDLAKLCKHLRNKKEWTQKQMAAALGASKRTYQDWEAGKFLPNGEATARLFILRDLINAK